MNWDPCPFLPVAITWAVIGTIILALTGWLNRCFIKNAALRHLAWSLALYGLFLMPLFQIVNSRARACHPRQCSLFSLTLGDAWIAGTLFTIARFAFGCLRLRNLRRQSSVFDSDAVDISGLKNRVGVFGMVEIRIAHTKNPNIAITWGSKNPIVLLPKGAHDWSPTRLTAALLHELGHVRRRDHLSQTCAFLVCALNWFNPFFWRAARRMEAEAEIAADDCAILAGIRPSSYAAELLHFASQLSRQRGAISRVETSMLRLSTVEDRIHAIIDPASTRGQIGFWRIAIVNGLVLFLFISAGFSMRSLNPPSKDPVCLPKSVP